MHDDPTQTYRPTRTLQSPRSGTTSDHSDQNSEAPANNPGERAFAAGMVCFALTGLVLMVLRSDWWGA
jgi:hypothetical protein